MTLGLPSHLPGTFRQWLQDVDSTGSLLDLADDLEETFDTPLELLELYVLPRCPGDTALVVDQRLLLDLGCDSQHEAKLFETWFSENCGTEGWHSFDQEATQELLMGVLNASLPALVDNETAGGSASSHQFRSTRSVKDEVEELPEVPGPSFEDWLKGLAGDFDRREAERVLKELFESPEDLVKLYRGPRGSLDMKFVEDLVLRPLRSRPPLPEEQKWTQEKLHWLADMSFEKWLLSLDPKNSLARYAGALREKFEDPEQVVTLYMRPQRGARTWRARLDTKLFHDLGVRNPEHMELFKIWFSNLPDLAEQPPAGVEALPDDVGGLLQDPSDFAAWLKLVALCGGFARPDELQRYLPFLQENFDDVAQLVEAYLVSDVTRQDQTPFLDVQIFEDLQVEPSHQPCFREWFDTFLKGLPEV